MKKQVIWFVHPAGVVRDLYVDALTEARFTAEVTDHAAAVLDQIHGRDWPTAFVLELLPDPAATWLFIEQVRNRQPGIPIVILTSLVRPDGANRARARRLGCAAFVGKPCGLNVLVDVVVRVVRGERGLEILEG